MRSYHIIRKWATDVLELYRAPNSALQLFTLAEPLRCELYQLGVPRLYHSEKRQNVIGSITSAHPHDTWWHGPKLRGEKRNRVYKTKGNFFLFKCNLPFYNYYTNLHRLFTCVKNGQTEQESKLIHSKVSDADKKYQIVFGARTHVTYIPSNQKSNKTAQTLFLIYSNILNFQLFKTAFTSQNKSRVQFEINL